MQNGDGRPNVGGPAAASAGQTAIIPTAGPGSRPPAGPPVARRATAAMPPVAPAPGMAGAPNPGGPNPGARGMGGPMTGAPAQGAPMPGAPMPGAPIPGGPMSGAPMRAPGGQGGPGQGRTRSVDGPSVPIRPMNQPLGASEMDQGWDLDEPSDDDSVEILTANLVHRPASRGLLAGIFALVIVLLVVVPAYFVIGEGKHNPAFATMDALGVPAWAATDKHDASIYSRFCVAECQINERDASSTKPVDETKAAYVTALTTAGWHQTSSSSCATKAAGSYTCWLLDERELDLWVRPSTCTMPAPPTSETGIDPEPTSTAPAAGTCAPTAVQIKIFDSVERDRVQRPTSG